MCEPRRLAKSQEMETRRRLLKGAYAELVLAREHLAHCERMFQGYKLLSVSGHVLAGDSIIEAERKVEAWLK